MSATTDPAASVESRESVRRRRAARPRGAKQLDSTALIYLVLVGVIIVSTVLTALEGRNFFSQGNIWAVLTAMSVLGLISIGQTLVILVGSLDLSVPYVVSLATVVAAGGMKGLDANIPAAVFNTLAVCAVVGLAMGLLVSVLARARLHRQPRRGPDRQRLPRHQLPGQPRRRRARPEAAGPQRHRRAGSPPRSSSCSPVRSW